MAEFIQNLDDQSRDALAKIALKRIRKICSGNGITKDQIRIGRFETDIISCEASLAVSLHIDTKSHTQKGQAGQNPLANRSAIAQTVQDYPSTLLNGPEAKTIIKETLAAREDKGLGMDAREKINLPALNTSYSCQEPCSTCGGQGRAECQNCRSTGQEQCTRCRGQRRIPCTYCQGTGQLQNQNGSQPCNHCQGSRLMPCDICTQRGTISCRQCGGQGKKSCQSCATTGIITHITDVAVQALTRFSYNRENLPKEVAIILDKQIAKLISKKSVTIHPYKDTEIEQGHLHLKYTISFPYGPIQFVVKEKPVQANLLGFKAQLYNVPSFLEGIVRTGVRSLQQAANQDGNIAEHLNKAANYKILGLAIMAASRTNAKQTMKMVKANYPYGVTNNFISKIAQDSRQAVRHVTRKPRYIGLGLGLLLTALLYSAYFLSGLRTELESALSSAQGTTAIDLIVPVIGTYITIFTAQFTTARALKKAIPAIKGCKVTPLKANIGKAFYYAIGGSILLYIAILAATPILGKPLPNWTLSLINKY